MKKRSRFFLIIGIIFLLVLIIIEPQIYMDAAIESLNLVVFKVFPSMFPFFIISRLLTLLGAGLYASKIFAKPLKYCYNSPPIGGFILSLSIISGYPIGAKLVSEFYENRILSYDDVKSIISYTSCSGPVFILGTVGVGILGDYKAGVLILASHILATFLNGFIYRQTSDMTVKSSPDALMNDNFFNNAIISSIQAMLQVGASIIFLNILITFCYHVGIINMLAQLSSLLGLNSNILECLFIANLEFTKGIQTVSANFIEKKDIIVIISTIISFGGLSIYIQSMNFLKKIGVSASYYLCTKLSQSILAYIISTILAIFLY